jgi:F-type H+-transporting ATPase subunit a
MRGGSLLLFSFLCAGCLVAASFAQEKHAAQPGHEPKEVKGEKAPGDHAPADKHAHGDKGHAKHAANAHPQEPNPMEHVLDNADWHLFPTFEPHHIHLPKIFGLQITKFMLLQVIAALLVVIIYVPLGQRMQSGAPPRGAFANAFESLLTFVRKEIAIPNLGEHHADHFVPFLWTLFLFILFNNLLGMLPFGGSATASIYVTLGLALIVFYYIHGSAVREMGFKHYLETLWPHIDVPFPMGLIIKPLVFVIEVVGVLVRNAVLAVRLFANMFAGHVVLAVILTFIHMAAQVTFGLWASITVASVLGILALSLLEIFVAFLQAFIFTFLTALFMGMAIHPQH